jgi:hypothetical protein
MLVISEQQMAAMEADHTRRKPARMAAWWDVHADLLGTRDIFSCRRLLESLADEIAFAGLENETQQFLFCAARVRMPDMGDQQYLLTMDAIVGPGDDREKLLAFDGIARTVPANG